MKRDIEDAPALEEIAIVCIDLCAFNYLWLF